jgi:hypothetical protein
VVAVEALSWFDVFFRSHLGDGNGQMPTDFAVVDTEAPHYMEVQNELRAERLRSY